MPESPSAALAQDILELKKRAARAEASGDLPQALTLMREILALHEERDFRTAAADIGRVRAIGEIGRQLISSLSMDKVFDTLYERVNRVLDAPVLTIALVEPDRSVLRYLFVMEGGQRVPPEDVPLDATDSLGVRCLSSGKELIIQDIVGETGDMPGAACLRHMGSPELRVLSAAHFPLKAADRIIGVMGAQSYVRRAYGPDEIDTLRTLAAYLSIALENARLYREVSELAITDSLTGVLNRRELFRRGEAEFARHDRYEGGISAILCDLDHFKNVNDEWGHAAGDAVLRGIAERIQSGLRGPDVLGRYGGEEFLMILPYTNAAGAYAIAERIRAAVQARPFSAGSGPDATVLPVTASFGIAEWASDISCFEVLVSRADEALYRAKALGRNRSEISEKGVYHEDRRD